MREPEENCQNNGEVILGAHGCHCKLGSFNFSLPFQSSGTMPGHKLTRAADTLIILSITGVASS